MSTNKQYWLAVGCASNAARSDIKRTGGQVVQLYSKPPVILVGIVYDSTAHPDDLAFNNGSEIQIDVHSTGLSLEWVSNDRLLGGNIPPCCSVLVSCWINTTAGHDLCACINLYSTPTKPLPE